MTDVTDMINISDKLSQYIFLIRLNNVEQTNIFIWL